MQNALDSASALFFSLNTIISAASIFVICGSRELVTLCKGELVELFQGSTATPSSVSGKTNQRQGKGSSCSKTEIARK